MVQALSARLAADADEADAAEAASALRELVCADAGNRRAAGRAGAVPRLLDRIRRLTCVDSIGALRNIANDAAASKEAGELGAVDVLADVVEPRRGVRGGPGGVDRRVVFARERASVADAERRGEHGEGVATGERARPRERRRDRGRAGAGGTRLIRRGGSATGFQV